MRVKYIDKDPPQEVEGALDYLAYLKDQINFAFSNINKTLQELETAISELQEE